MFLYKAYKQAKENAEIKWWWNECVAGWITVFLIASGSERERGKTKSNGGSWALLLSPLLRFKVDAFKYELLGGWGVLFVWFEGDPYEVSFSGLSLVNSVELKC